MRLRPVFFCMRELFGPERGAARVAGGGKDTRPLRRRAAPPCARRRPHRPPGAVLAAALALAGAVAASTGVARAQDADGRASASADASTEPPVAVASSLRFAWPALLDAATGAAGAAGSRVPARASFGASLTLAGQMLAGAPFELLVAADTESVARLVDGALVDAADAVRYADGRLALAVRPGSPLVPAPGLEALAALLEAEPSTRLAIPNPAAAPYGRAALEALASAGLGELSPARVARGENAGQALQYLLAGAVDAALVPRSLVVGAPPGTDVVAAPVPEDAHAPIEHALATVRTAGDAARALAAFLGSCAARGVLEAEGFAAPAGIRCTGAGEAPEASPGASPSVPGSPR